MLSAAGFSLLFMMGADAGHGPDYLDDLLREANRLELASDPYWAKLLHYHDRNLGSRRSAAEGVGFLLADRGNREPAAELEATLAAFFEQPVEQAEHPQCRFIARYRWLDEHLHFDESKLPRHPCPQFEEWYRAVGADRLTLVFASAYLNNPASMYGHTLLRVDQAGNTSSDQLVAYAINHAAKTDETNGIVFAVRGIFGGYHGDYSMLPYYDKVKEYNDLESRDLWEYELALTHEETDRILWHLWELKGIGFRYYFFLQNCSYRLLELLELARPGLELTKGFRFWAIPTDTVRKVLETEGLLRGAHFRPGAATVLEYHLDLMTGHERALARELALGELAPDDARVAELGPEGQARVLHVAYEYLHYLLLDGKAQEETAAPRLRALLSARSRVPVSGPLESPGIPEVRPDQGHDTARVAVGWGIREDDSFVTLRVRPAYHDLLDPQAGYQENAQIRFVDFEVRRDSDSGSVQLERLDLVDINSVAPRDRFIAPSSWNVNVSLARQRVPSGARPLVTELGGGSAWAFRFRPPSGIVAYGGWQSVLQVGHELPRSWRLGAGPRLGALAELGRFGRIQLEAQSLWYLDESKPSWTIRLEQRIPLTHTLAIGLHATREETFEQATNEVAAALHWYF